MDKEAINKAINSARIPPLVYIILVALVLFCCTRAEKAESVPQIGVTVFFLVLVAFFVIVGLSVTCRYIFDDDGLTVIWYGVFRHKFLWNSLPYAGVCLTSSRSSSKTPIIICAKHEWQKNLYAPMYYFFFPFSAFKFPYSPSLYSELKKVCPNLDYVANRERVIEIYHQKSKNK